MSDRRARGGFLTALLFMACSNNLWAEEIRDFYDEPGLHPFKENISSLNESIDPFSGKLQLSHVDLRIPGNGGMDIAVTRYYLSPSERFEWTSGAMGVGWTMHFGRLVVPSGHADKVCAQTLFSVSTLDNPSFERPDGSRELLVLADDGTGELVSKGNWRMRCNGSQKVVLSPEGIRYELDHVATSEGGDNRSWYATRILNPRGNGIAISYEGEFHPYVTSISGFENGASDGRLVTFNYESGACRKLTSIESGGRSWLYRYENMAPADGMNCSMRLDAVVMPTGESWEYSYFGDLDPDAAGRFALRHIKYPYGGEVSYTYQFVTFDPKSNLRTVSVSTKVTGGTGVEPGTWRYTFFPHSVEAICVDDAGEPNGKTGCYLDKTVVTGPGKRSEYVHAGIGNAGLNNVWTVGLLSSKQDFDDSGNQLRGVANRWVGGQRILSKENYWHGRDYIDEHVTVPVLLETNYDYTPFNTRYEDHDEYGNPRTIIETSTFASVPERIKRVTYYNDPARWIIGKVKDVTIEGVGTVSRTYNVYGEVVQEVTYGVPTAFTYTSVGDLATRQDALGRVTRYEDYKRGIAAREIHPEGVTITRSINDDGTIASERNGRGLTTHYSYDAIGRLERVQPPLHSAVTVDRGFSADMSYRRMVTRGPLSTTTRYDGFGRSTQVMAQAGSETINRRFGYDVHGRRIFESYPNATQGTQYRYDAIDRLTRVTHADGATRQFAHEYGGAFVLEEDENGHISDLRYLSYGQPDNGRWLSHSISPEGTVTNIFRDAAGMVTSVFQGQQLATGSATGFFRNFAYDSRRYLISETHSETGAIIYGRDAVGNMISRQLGTEGTTYYTYDGLNRLVFVNYPGSTPDVTRSYDGNGNLLTLNTPEAQREYAYDDNDNLIEESLSLGGSYYRVGYGYNTLDALARLEYPSGRSVEYTPDGFGRPTRAEPYLDAVRYHPGGLVAQIDYANGRTSSSTLNTRQWMDWVATDGGVSDVEYGYDPAGNLTTASDLYDLGASLENHYDGLNRLVESARGNGDFVRYTYDARGNITQWQTQSNSRSFQYSNQRLARITTTGLGGTSILDYTHDSAGRRTRAANYLSAYGSYLLASDTRYSFDTAGQLRAGTYTDGGPVRTLQFVYDGNSLRVSRDDGDEITHLVHGSDGRLLGEYRANDRHTEHIYLGRQRIASVRKVEPPIAAAGPDQKVAPGASVELDGSGSTDPDGRIVAYAWTQSAGPTVTLSTPTGAQARFTAPASDATLVFTLSVRDDDGETATDTITVQVGAAVVLRGDIDGNGVVDRDDVLALKPYLRQPATACPPCDLNGDGKIDGIDARQLALLVGP